MYDIEKYYNAGTVSEAVTLLNEHPDTRIISGGSDVLIKIREGRMAGTSLVSIRDIEELKGIERKENGDIYIGAGTVFSHITADPIIQKYIPVLGEAVDQVGGPQIRNIGTIGGNICNGAVSADSVPTVFPITRAAYCKCRRRKKCPCQRILSWSWTCSSQTGGSTYTCDYSKE